MIYPDWKIKLAERCVLNGEEHRNKDVRDLVSVLNDTCDNAEAAKEVLEAYNIYKNDLFTKEIVEGCMLCHDYTVDGAHVITGISARVINTYSYFFFDPSVFRYRTHKFEYVRTYKSELEEGKLYKQWAISVGMNFFMWHFKIGHGNLVPREILLDLINDSFFRSKEHINESITSSTTKEALKWIKQGTDSLVALQKLGGNDTESVLAKFRIALTHKDDTKSTEEISDAEIIT